MPAAIVALILGLLKLLLPALLNRAPAVTGIRRPDLKHSLLDRIRGTWGVLLLAVAVSGCAGRTIYVPTGEPVRIRETIIGAKVWVMDAGGRPVAGVMDIPEGWFALPAPEPVEDPR